MSTGSAPTGLTTSDFLDELEGVIDCNFQDEGFAGSAWCPIGQNDVPITYNKTYYYTDSTQGFEYDISIDNCHGPTGSSGNRESYAYVIENQPNQVATDEIYKGEVDYNHVIKITYYQE